MKFVAGGMQIVAGMVCLAYVGVNAGIVASWIYAGATLHNPQPFLYECAGLICAGFICMRSGILYFNP